MKLLSPAKINLFLEVASKRSDSYHNIVTIMQTVNLYDEIYLTLADSNIEFDCDWSGLCKSKVARQVHCKTLDNIAYHAATELKKYLRESKGVKIIIKKHIPVAAGLGGGSSNAATVLKGLLKLWSRDIPDKKLEKIALGLGADVPFFLREGCCLCEGIGEKLTKLIPYWIRKPLSLILVNPGFHILTSSVYSNLRYINNPVDRKYLSSIISFIESGNRCSRILFNRLEKVVFEQYPELKRIKNILIRKGAFISLVSGSGPTVFGVFDEYKDAKKVLTQIKKKYPFTWLVRTIN